MKDNQVKKEQNHEVIRTKRCRPEIVSYIVFRSRCLFLVVTFILLLSLPLTAGAEETPKIELTPEEQAWLAEHPEIVLGAPTDYPPMVIKRADGTHVGVLLDFFEEVSQHLNTRIRLHIEDSWADVQEKAQNREIDGLAFGGRDPSRDVHYNATDIVVSTYFSVFARSQNEYRLKSFSDLKGMRIGYKRAARPTRSLLEKLPSAILKPYDDHESMTQALLSKEIDVIVAWMSFDHWRKEKLQGTIDNILLIDEYPIEMVTHIRKDWPELIPILNKAIVALQQDELPRINNKWFGQWPQLSIAISVPLTPEERAWLDTHPVLRIGLATNSLPLSTFDKNGNPYGIVADYFQALRDYIGLDYEFVSLTFPEVLVATQERKIDLFAGFATPERKKYAFFSEPLFSIPYVIITRQEMPFIQGTGSLHGKKASVIRDIAMHRYLAKAEPNIELVLSNSVSEGLKAVSDGVVDAYIGDALTSGYMINQEKITNLKVAAPVDVSSDDMRFAVRSDWPEMKSILNKFAANLPPEKHNAIFNKWMTIRYERSFDYTLLWQVLAGAGLVFLAIILWNKQLSRKVKERTSQLMETELRFRATFEQAAVGVAHVSTKGRFLRVNRKFCDIVGYSDSEIRELTFMDITHPDDLDEDIEYMRQVKSGEIETYSMDKRYYRKDGSVIWINLTISQLFDKEGNPEYFISVIKDISDSKQAEEALHQSHDVLEHLNSTVPDAVFSVKMPERVIEWANDSFNILGYEAEECIGESTEKFYASPEEYQTVGALLEDVIRDGRDVILTEAMLRRKNGEVFPAEINAAVYRENGKVVSITALARDISERKKAEIELNEAYTEIEQLQEKLQAESAYLQEEIKLEHNFENIIGQSEALKYVLHRVEQVAVQDSTVLILGETGTGKELIARALHKLSLRRERALVKVNCAALPGELIESELFGREKGAFTGATTTQVGRFELARGSTLFLDEIGELPLELQAKLLRVLESGEFERLGSSSTLKSDVRIVAASNRNLEEEVRNKRFREDLLYRLKVFPITVPPLRDRLDDVPLLVNSFVQFFSRTMGKPGAVEFTKRSIQELQSYSWPGNVRELRHAVEGALISARGNKLHFDLPKTEDVAINNFKSFEEMEREYILEVLKSKNWKIGGEDSAASILGMPSSTLRSRIKKLGLTRPGGTVT